MLTRTSIPVKSVVTGGWEQTKMSVAPCSDTGSNIEMRTGLQQNNLIFFNMKGPTICSIFLLPTVERGNLDLRG
jgi:hypothetical protein